MIIGARLVKSTHSAWSEFAVQSAAAQTAIFEHVEKITLAALASGSPATRFSKDRMHALAASVGLWQQILKTI